MVSTYEGITDINPISHRQCVIIKSTSARKSLRQLYTYYNSNLGLLSAGFMPLNKCANKSDLEVCYVPLYQSYSSKQKSINRS